MMSHCRFSRP